MISPHGERIERVVAAAASPDTQSPALPSNETRLLIQTQRGAAAGGHVWGGEEEKIKYDD